MATYQDLIEASLRKLGRLGSGESATSTERTDGLADLNRLLGRWNAKLGPVHMETLDSLTLTASQASYTIGTSGNFNVARPVKIISAAIRDSANIDHPMEVISHKEYQSILSKTIETLLPFYLAYNPTIASSQGTILLWPVPSSGLTLRLNSLKPLADGALGTTVTLPPGYEDAIVWNLAMVMAPEYGFPVTAEIRENAQDSLWDITRANDSTSEMSFDPLAPGQDAFSDDINLLTQ